MQVAHLEQLEPFTTLDGSTIRELAGPTGAAANQSLAEASVSPGGATAAHYHRTSEELYFFTAGRGRMRLGEQEDEVVAGDCVVIPPGVEHELRNLSAEEPLVLLCCCAPAYSDADTVITGS